MKYYLAIDIGASSGRCIVGYLKNKEIVTDEVYRFSNGMINYFGDLIWDIDNILLEVKKGIKISLEKYQNIESLSIDTWGVDYVLLNRDEVIYPVYAYRSDRTSRVIDEVHQRILFEELYQITGCQFQTFNTIYQLYSDLVMKRLDQASDFLYIPEYIIYKLTGKKVHEYTMASTSSLTDCVKKEYSLEIIKRLGFNESLFKSLSKPKSFISPMKDDVIKELGGNINVSLCATHDTASAVEGINIPDGSLYLSSGTWSLLGAKVDEAIVSKKAYEANYSNEYGPNYIRFQKNIMGLWIVQNLSKELDLSFVKMIEMAKSSNYQEIFDVNDKVFFNTNNMVLEIRNWFKERDIDLPKNNNDIINATYHSLAYSYKVAIEEIESILEKKFDCLYITGGGAKNEYLNALTEEYCKIKVHSIPIEASAIGNLLNQINEE